MPIQLDARLLADFDRPIDVLEDCHRRIERFLRMLDDVVSSATDDGRMTEDAAGALQVALRYFRNAAPKHTADEEESLFPRLRATGDPRVEAVLADLERLESDHDRADELHDVVDELGSCWLRTGVLERAQLERLAATIGELRAIYAAHIAYEDSVLFTVAREVLSEPALGELAVEMRARRTTTG